MVGIILSSCNHREFDFDEGGSARMDVIFDWVNDPAASPASMSVYLFPDEGGIPYRYDLAGRDGGTIRITPGLYHAVCLNNDVTDIFFRGEEAHHTFEVYVSGESQHNFNFQGVKPQMLPRAHGAEDEPMVYQPPMLWSVARRDVKVEETDERQQLVMQPSRIIDIYEVTVLHIRNVRYLSAISATISGMSEGYLAGRMQHNDNAVTMPLEMSHDAENATAEGRFYTFGHCAATDRAHKLTIFAILTNGQGYYFEYDVTDQTHGEPDDNNIYHIIIDNLNVPEPTGTGGEGGGGFMPSVSDWETEYISITM